MVLVSTLASTTSSPPSAIQKRANRPDFGATWSIRALGPALPLLFPVAPHLSPSPKSHYRSQYRYLGAALLLDETRWAGLNDLEIALYLFDFSPLESLLAQHYAPSIKGQLPFHPVSMFLCICLRRELNLSWRRLAGLLAGDNGAGWCTLFGFSQGQTPSAAGLRYFFNAIGPASFDDLCPRFIELLGQHGLLPTRSTYPGDPADRGVTVSEDGQLHPARSHPSCQLATDECYQPLGSTPSPAEASPRPDTPAEQASRQANRPCRARDKGLPGCACDTAACREQCTRASRLDPDARFIHYEGHNDKSSRHCSSNGHEGKHGKAKGQGTPDKEHKSRGIDIFGYRSVVDRILDDRFAVAWTAQSKLYSANTDERTIFAAGQETLLTSLPALKIGEWLDDAGVGYQECLDAIWRLGALRMVEIRADKGDRDPAVCLRRGYDGEGHPLCCHGYVMRANGYDNERRRTKYVCAQVCRREPRREGETIAPMQGCPYLDEGRPVGQVVNVGRTLPDGSVRLAREIAYGSPTWKARYGRRNLSESRNGLMEGMGLKRMRSYGLERDTKEVQLADFLINLRTLGRLVRQASALECARL